MDELQQQTSGQPPAEVDQVQPSPTKHSRSRIATIGLIVALVVILGAVFILHERGLQPQPLPSLATVGPRQAAVTVIKDGFEPAILSIKVGTTVTWTNQDMAPHRIAADPYPTHTTLPDLDSKNAINPSGTYSYTFTKAGSISYHDEYNPTLSGTVLVQQ